MALDVLSPLRGEGSPRPSGPGEGDTVASPPGTASTAFELPSWRGWRLPRRLKKGPRDWGGEPEVGRKGLRLRPATPGLLPGTPSASPRGHHGLHGSHGGTGPWLLAQLLPPDSCRCCQGCSLPSRGRNRRKRRKKQGLPQLRVQTREQPPAPHTLPVSRASSSGISSGIRPRAPRGSVGPRTGGPLPGVGPDPSPSSPASLPPGKGLTPLCRGVPSVQRGEDANLQGWNQDSVRQYTHRAWCVNT